MQTKLNLFEQCLKIFETIVEFFNKFGVIKIFKTLIYCILIYWLLILCFKPSIIFEKIERIKTQTHITKVEKAIENSQIIQSELELLRQKTNASRAILMTFHNQKQSLNGIPYVYLTCTNEAVADSIMGISEKYEVLKCSLYPMVNYIIKNDYWSGDIENLKTIDKSLAYRMIGNDVKHCCFVNIEGENLLGVLVLTYTEEIDHNCQEIEMLVRKSAMKIGIILGKEE